LWGNQLRELGAGKVFVIDRDGRRSRHSDINVSIYSII